MRSSSVVAGAFAAALAVLPSPVWAQATPQGADQIRRQMTDWINLYITPAGADSVIVLDGPVQVEPRGDRYAVLLPRINIAGDADGVLAIDPIAIDLVPLPNGWYDATWTLPQSTSARDPAGQEVARLTIGSQSGSGTFAPEFQTFMDLDFRLGDVVLRPLDEPGELRIATIAMTVDSTDAGGGAFDSEVEASIDNLSFNDGQGQRMDFGQISLTGSVDNIHLAENAAFAQELNRLTGQLDQRNSANPPPQYFRDLNALIARTPTLLNGLDLTYGFEDVRVIDQNNTVDLGGGSFGFRMSGLESATSTIGLTLDIGAIGIVPQPPFSQFIPTETTLDVALVGLPNEQFLAILQSFLETSAQAGPDRAGEVAAVRLQQAIMTSGARLVVEDAGIETAGSRLDLTGEVTPNQAAAMGVVANATLDIAGMPALINELQAVPDSQQIIQGLTALQAVGAQATSDDGQPVRRYEFSLDPQGTPILNGTDMRPLLGSIMGGGGPQQGGSRQPPQPTQPGSK